MGDAFIDIIVPAYGIKPGGTHEEIAKSLNNIVDTTVITMGRGEYYSSKGR